MRTRLELEARYNECNEQEQMLLETIDAEIEAHELSLDSLRTQLGECRAEIDIIERELDKIDKGEQTVTNKDALESELLGLFDREAQLLDFLSQLPEDTDAFQKDELAEIQSRISAIEGMLDEYFTPE